MVATATMETIQQHQHRDTKNFWWIVFFVVKTANGNVEDINWNVGFDGNNDDNGYCNGDEGAEAEK